MRALIPLLCLVSATASAVPLTLEHQGRLFDQPGVPLDGPNDLGLLLYDTPSGGTAIWQDSWTGYVFEDGYFSVTLGEGSPLDAATFDDDDIWLAVQIGAAPELAGRVKISSVPFAIRASASASATLADRATVADSADSVAWGDVSGAPSTTLDDISCSADEVLTWSGSSWGCGVIPAADAGSLTGVLDIANIPVGGGADQVAAGDHSHTADDVTGGVFDVARLPVGTGSADVAAGDHLHQAADVTGGVFDLARLPVGTGGTQVAAGDHAHDFADLSGTVPASAIDTSGGLTLVDVTTCSAEGQLAWDVAEGKLKVCDGTDWQYVDAGGLSDGFYRDATDAQADGLTHYWLFDSTVNEYPGFGGRNFTPHGALPEKSNLTENASHRFKPDRKYRRVR